MGLARAAESTGYPGPKHVLDLAKELQLTATRQRSVTEIRLRVIADAQRYGRAIVDAERGLDEAFRTGAINEIDLASRVRSIAAMQGELRLVHLAAHLEVKPLLTAQQLRRYSELRLQGTRTGSGPQIHANRQLRITAADDADSITLTGSRASRSVRGIVTIPSGTEIRGDPR
jgi:hypothetical protein